MAHVSRTTLVQALRRFEARGLVERGYRTLRVVDAPGLRAIAAGG
jgi:DNA-binding GntR family transcriptional regulator